MNIMLSKIKNITATLLILTIVFVSPVSVYAETNNGANNNNNNTAESTCNTSILPCMTIPEMIQFAINVLSAVVGVAAVGSLVYAGILYTTSAGNPEQAKKAITWIRNVVIGIVCYALMYLVLNYIVPGGVGP